MGADIVSQVDKFLLRDLRNPMSLTDVTNSGFPETQVEHSTRQQLIPMRRYRFTHWDQTRDTRRPQGVVAVGDFIINSWYFTDKGYRWDKWAKNAKLTVMSLRGRKQVNVAPVQLSDDGESYVNIQSHAGGLALVGNYLYMADSSTTSIRVFDMNRFYNRAENDSLIKSDQKFIREYSCFIPEVGRIQLATPDNAGPSYISRVRIARREYLLTGNFYSTVDDDFEPGGKSMIWLLPIKRSRRGFHRVDVQRPIQEIDPIFPSGPEKGKNVTRIQGAVIQDNFLILSRSYWRYTHQLMVLGFNANFSEQDSELFFSGTSNAPKSHEAENWLWGCEDLSLSARGGNLYTVTEFDDHRAVYRMRTEDVLKLADPNRMSQVGPPRPRTTPAPRPRSRPQPRRSPITVG